MTPSAAVTHQRRDVPAEPQGAVPILRQPTPEIGYPGQDSHNRHTHGTLNSRRLPPDMSQCDVALAVSDSGGGVLRECHAGVADVWLGVGSVRVVGPALLGAPRPRPREAGLCLELDGDSVVDSSEDQRAEGHGCGGGDHEIDHVGQTRQMA